MKIQDILDGGPLDGMKENADDDYIPSPRGVLEIPISGSDSDHSGGMDSPVAFGPEEKPAAKPMHLKKLFDNAKMKSVRRFAAIPLMNGFELSKKNLRRKIGWNRSNEETIDCGDFVVPKPTWRNFSHQELAAATDDFSSERMIGKGGHAEVFKGTLPDGREVAVKKIMKIEKNDEDRVGDFLSELGIIAHIDHPNAAKLIGFSVDGDLHLVLQLSPHGSLASHLHGTDEKLEWEVRFKVAVGVAEGLNYLHSGCRRRIIHRDISASNILLTDDYQPQISDFGLAKWLPDKWINHIVHPIEGTFGYMAPEYFMHGIVDEKTDVFAFGVLLLELITGRRAVDSSSQSLVMWAKPLLEKNCTKDLTDPRVEGNYNSDEMERVISAALACLHQSPGNRLPMARVLEILRGESGNSIEPKHRRSRSRSSSTVIMMDPSDLEDYSSTNYLNDLSRHMQLVLE